MKPKHEEGITLVALIITIIVLLILEGITVSLTIGHLTIGQNGLIKRTQEANEENIKAEIQETIRACYYGYRS